MSSHIYVKDNSYYTGLYNHIRNDSYAVEVTIDGVDCHYQGGFGSYSSAYSAGKRWLEENGAKERERIKRNIKTFGLEYYFPKPEPIEKRIARENRISQKVNEEVTGELGCLAIIGIAIWTIICLFAL